VRIIFILGTFIADYIVVIKNHEAHFRIVVDYEDD